ncbi:MAG: hypothetical protein KDB21_12365 [Acidimicrobiales bacterium]|nr:hypothetical protein [Acidimicrobiales bacterium]
MKSRTRIAAATCAIIAAAAVVAPPAQAKGGSSPGVPTVSGPCSGEWYITPELTHYPLNHPNGVVSVDIVMVGGIPTAQEVCLDQGWTVDAKSTTDGIQLQFSYDDRTAIDFKYVLGKTDIRFK